MDICSDPRLAQIQAVLPEPILTAIPNETGEDFSVIEINGRWIFRFARQPVGACVLAQELRFLPAFGPMSPLPVPQYRWSGVGFGGYPKLAGERLDGHALERLPAGDQAAIAAQFGQFLAALHRFPLEQARRLELSQAWGGHQIRALDYFWQELAGRLSPPARSYARACAERFLARQAPLAVIHGDFSSDHFLFDPASRRLSGILDFGDLTIFDPAYDFKAIRWEFGVDFLHQVCASYDLSRDPGLLGRLDVLLRAHPLLEAANGGLFGSPQRLERALAEIERRARD